VRRCFPFTSFAQPRHANPLLFGGLLFALGLAAGGWLRPAATARGATPTVAIEPAAGNGVASAAASDMPLAHRLDPNIVYPAELIRVIDGDTFEARVRVWPGLDVDTKVRLRGVDAAELHARCDSELAQAQAARAALQQMLGEGGLTISRVGVDKYGGRVDATIATRGTADVSAALLKGGFARAYNGGRRGSWCDEQESVIRYR
jgi:endonuclease YncB( thermonuclease family)